MATGIERTSKMPSADMARLLAARTPRTAREREVLRVAASIGGGKPIAAVSKAKHEVLNWVSNRVGRLPAAAWKYDGFEHRAGGRNCTAVRIADETRETWAIRSDDPDKQVPQRVWTTEVAIASGPGHRPLFGLRLLVTSPEMEVDVEPAVPGIVQQLASRCGLYAGNKKLSVRPRIVQSDEDAARLVQVLLHPKRRLPFFVASVPEGSVNEVGPSIDSGIVAAKTLGLAVTVVVADRFTRVLTERLGKQLSVYDGSVRVYFPGFADDAEPYEHRLISPEGLSLPDEVRRISGELRRVAAVDSRRRLRLGYHVLSFEDVREKSDDTRLLRLKEEKASESVQLEAAQQQIRILKRNLRKAEADQQWLSDEHSEAEDRAKVAEAQASQLDYRVRQLRQQLEVRNEAPDATIPLPARWTDFADWCDENLAPRVRLSSRARREVKNAFFVDVAMAARCLRWLANEYADRRMKGGEGNLRGLIEDGVVNERCGADSFSFKWRDRNREVEWHVKNGGNTRDPGRCLRIYYFWDDMMKQVIVASMPAHIRTGAT